MIIFDKEVVSISSDLSKEIKSYGANISVCLIGESTSTDDIESLYNEFYGQVDSNNMVYENSYDISSIVSYEPIYDKRKGSGFEENCDLGATILLKDLYDLGYISTIEEVSDKIKRKTIIKVNTQEYTVSSIRFASIYKGIPIVLKLSCKRLIKCQ